MNRRFYRGLPDRRETRRHRETHWQRTTWRDLLVPAGIGLVALLSLLLPKPEAKPLPQAQYHDCTMNAYVIHCIDRKWGI